MGLCDLPSDHPGLVISTYLAALLPWSVLALWDPIDRHWRSFGRALLYSVLYLLVTLLPYMLLITYAVLQSCSRVENDLKELMTSVILIVGSLWNLARSIRGLAALWDVRQLWKSMDPDDRRNLKLWDVQVSNMLVDNDFDGEAPRVSYMRSLLLWQNILIDIGERLCVDAVWSLWMCSTKREVPQYSPEDEQFREDSPASVANDWKKRWKDRCFLVDKEEKTKERISPVFVARLLANDTNFRPNVRERLVNWMDRLERAMEDSKDSWAFHWCPVHSPFRIRRRFHMRRRRFRILRSLVDTFVESSRISKLVVEEKIGKIHADGRERLYGTPLHVIRELSLHLRLNRVGFGTVESRVMLALGLPAGVQAIKAWLKPSSDGDSRTKLQGMMLALFFVCENYPCRCINMGFTSKHVIWRLTHICDKIRKLLKDLEQSEWLGGKFRELHLSRSSEDGKQNELKELHHVEVLEDVLEVTSDKWEKHVDKWNDTVRTALESLQEKLSEELKRLTHTEFMTGENTNGAAERGRKCSELGCFRGLFMCLFQVCGCQKIRREGFYRLPVDRNLKEDSEGSGDDLDRSRNGEGSGSAPPEDGNV